MTSALGVALLARSFSGTAPIGLCLVVLLAIGLVPCLRLLIARRLKVDRGFLRGACRDASRKKAILEASLGVARQPRMKTAAEGVEDRAGCDFPHAAGCDLAQGRCIAKPLLAADLAGRIGARTPRRVQPEASAS